MYMYMYIREQQGILYRTIHVIALGVLCYFALFVCLTLLLSSLHLISH